MADNALVKKLGIKPGQTVLVLNAPQGFLQNLDPLPAGTQVKTAADGTFEFIQVFVSSKADVDRYAPSATRALKPGGALWFAYPKKSAKTKTDVSRDEGWDAVSAQGLRPVSLVALDDTWSALRFRPIEDVKPRSSR